LTQCSFFLSFSIDKQTEPVEKKFGLVRFVFLFSGRNSISGKSFINKASWDLHMKPMYLSRSQHDKLTSELKNMKQVERPKVIRDIAEAREYGDLSENAEYAAAKEKQALIERKIARLEETLARARVMTEEMMSSEKVHIGSRVKLVDIHSNEEVVYEIVPTAEFNTFDPDAVSGDSPVGKALIGKGVNDTVEIKVPAGTLTYRVIEVM
jgi:transcription elongation factor GreA